MAKPPGLSVEFGNTEGGEETELVWGPKGRGGGLKCHDDRESSCPPGRVQEEARNQSREAETKGGLGMQLVPVESPRPVHSLMPAQCDLGQRISLKCP